MIRKIARTGIAVLALAGAASLGIVLPAHAVAPGEEIVITYYSDARETTVVGVYEFGCVFYSSGTMTAYHTTHAYDC